MKNIYKTIITTAFIFLFISINAQSPIWKNVGPTIFPETVVGQIHGIGRCTQIKFHPTDANKIYVASSSGGLYYSADKGVTYTNLGTDNIINVQSASVCVDFTNDQIIYWGTGDPNYYSSGVGVYKTTDGGTTWNPSNTGMGNRLVVELLMLPTNHQVLIAATNNGIYKSTDGGANWTLKSSATAMYNMDFKPSTNGQTIYAAAGKGFFRSTNAGDTWTQISSAAFVFGGNGCRVAVTPANANVVYVGNVGANTSCEIYKSTDGGTTFTNMRSETAKWLAGYSATSSGQGDYNFDIEVSPTNENEIYVCGHIIWRSTNSGATWTQQQTNWSVEIHTDQHHLLFNPYVAGELWNANDGGVWKNNNNGAGVWTPMSDGLNCTEIYHFASSRIQKDLSYIGTQDNGGFYYYNGIWTNNRGGDWGPLEYFDYTSNYVYSDETANRTLIPNNTGNNLNLPYTASNSAKSRYAFTPANTNIAYVVSTGNVYRSSNITSSTPSWTLIYTLPSGNALDIEADPGNADVLYIIADNKTAYRSDNATSTATFTTLTIPSTYSTPATILPIKSTSVVYCSVGAQLFRSINKGGTWTNYSTGFPSGSVNGLVADRFGATEAVYASYPLGVYYRDNTKTSWVNYSAGLPIVTDITDLFIYDNAQNQGYLRVGFYGKGLWESPLVSTYRNINLDLVSPTNNATFNSPATITLTATATATTGSITKVEFYNGTTLLTTITSAPYTYSWTNVNYGTYSITAVAYDDAGKSLTSNAASIQVSLTCTPLTGTTFGTSPAYAAGSEYDKVFDGNTSTFFDYMYGSNGYSGLDLGTAKSISGIRYYPRAGQTARMVGGKFQASNTANFSTGVVDIYTIASEPSMIWNDLGFTNTSTYRYYRYLSAQNGYCNIAEVQLCAIANENPTVTITAPANNAIYPASPSTVTIIATATDIDGTIAKVEFYNGTTLLGSDNSSPYTYSWTNVAEGTYQIKAVATDNLGGTGTSSIITIIVGNQKPTVAITSPLDNAVFAQPASIKIDATASDADGSIAKVEFYNGTTLIGTSTTSPYTYTWTNVVAGTYALTAKAYDNSTGITTSSIINVTVGNQKPVVTITAPADNAMYGQPATVVITADASDADGTITVVEFYNGTTLLSTDNTAPYEYTWTNVGPNSYQITAKATDNSGGTTTSTIVNVFVGNQKPIVLITSPADVTAFTTPATIIITALASDMDGTINKVEFYNGSTLLGTSLTAPYTYTWSNVTIGNYSITAKAYDNVDATTISTAVTVSVNNGCSAAAWDPTIAYVLNNIVSYNGRIYKALWWTKNEQPDLNTGSGKPWVDNGACSAANQLPAVTINTPTNNDSYFNPATIAIAVTSSDADGSVVKIQYYNGTTLVGETTTSPFSFTWNNVATGDYQLTAVATDDKDATATSASVSISVIDVTTLVKEDANAEKINVYPNPNTGDFYIRFTNLNDNQISYRIIDQQGKLIQSDKVENTSAEQHIQLHEANGNYIIQFEIDNKSIISKRINVVKIPAMVKDVKEKENK